MKHCISIVLVALLVAAASGRSVAAADPSERPNFLLILTDDQCFDTIRALGNEEIETPNLDRLVRRGTTFTHCYNQGSWTGAVCVASRTMLLTGRYLWHAQALNQRLEQEREAGRLWPQYFARAGYETYFTGKWHVRADVQLTFQQVRHERPGMPNQTPAGYHRPREGQEDFWRPWDPQFGGFWQGGVHWSEVLRDDAIAFLQQATEEERPFFMYLAFNAAHDPRQSPREYIERYPLEKITLPRNFLPEYPFKEAIGCGPQLRDEQLAPFPRTPYAVKVHRQEYYALITHMDEQIGKILDKLEQTGEAENTYILFTSDHGLAVGQHGLMGKQNMFEHSVRVPLIIAGPRVPRGQRVEAPVYLQDIMPTTLELAGITVPEHVQFRSLWPLIEGRAERTHEAIYGAYLDLQRMVREDHWKLVIYPKAEQVLLFNLAEDPHEMRNLADDSRYAEVLERLRLRLEDLQNTTGDPLQLPQVRPSVPREGEAPAEP